jgi:hypothetical protein
MRFARAFLSEFMRLRGISFVFWLVLAVGARGEDHWSYVPPVAAETEAGAHPVDALLGRGWAKAGVRAAKMAEPRRWIERAAFTLTGLPPSVEQIQRIEATPDEATWRELIDELLASPAYGERWARHWMDVARYADTQGYNFDQDNRYPFAYTYRDWLIRAFDQDLPYGDFIRMQLAADLVVDRPDHPDVAALGFLTVGPRSGGPETIDDRVDVIARGFLSSTVACARCHKHKTDPISMEDYYSIYSILENTREPEDKPVIGVAEDAAAHQAYLAEVAKLEAEDRAVRQAMVDQIRAAESMAVYLDLAWSAQVGDWDQGRATSESFKRGRYRPKVVLVWRDFLRKTAQGEGAEPRLAEWAAAMQAAGEDGGARMAACKALADEWAGVVEESPLRALAQRRDCPLSFGVERMGEVMDVEDGNANRARRGAMSRLDAEHAGSPPRAMSLADRPDYQPARTYKRGNPAAPDEPFERQWLSFLGGGAFEAGKSPRLALAEKIADPANPLTARVWVNRVWAWHFGAPLADPGDFGPQEAAPPLLALLDELAVRFAQSGGSTKDLHRLLLTSRAFRLAADGPAENDAVDEANSWFWKWNRRRADFEAMRDRLLASAGSLDLSRQGGRSISLETETADRRRTLYAFVDRYALPTTFVSFDLPHPDHHSPQRAETTVPQQALWFLNGPLILRQAARLAGAAEFQAIAEPRGRVEWLFQRIYQRSPDERELAMILGWLAAVDPADYAPRLGGVWEIRHAPDEGGVVGDARAFPLFADGAWKTGPDVSTAPIQWLYAEATGGHAAENHALILRWRALGAGEARVSGNLKRTQKGGADLVWHLTGSGVGEWPKGRLKVNGRAAVRGPWVKVEAGDTVDFILRAPQGASFGGFSWDFLVEGRESADAKPVEISTLQRQFPTSDGPPPPPSSGDPWADLIQMLWASNEFHFIH